MAKIQPKGTQFGKFGDQRDERSSPYYRQVMYQPEGSKSRYELYESNGMVTAHRLGKPDSILPGGRPAKQLAGALSTWSGGTGSPEGHKEILKVDVGKGHQGKGVATAMLQLATDRYPNLSHSGSLSAEGARWAHANPLPGDTARTKERQALSLTADAATAMLGGPRRTGYV
jgi:hypothetical protein